MTELSGLTDLPELPPWFVWMISDNRRYSSAGNYTLSLEHAKREYTRPSWFARLFGRKPVATGRWYSTRFDWYNAIHVDTYTTPKPYTGDAVLPARRDDLPERALETLENAEIILAALSILSGMEEEKRIQARFGAYPPKRLPDTEEPWDQIAL